MSKIRYAHPSHIDKLFITGTDHAFYLRGTIKTAFQKPINGLMRIVVCDDTSIVGGPFNTIEEVLAFIEKEFPNHVPSKVVVDRIVRTRWINQLAA